MTNKNVVGYWIKAKGHEKFEDTAPELAFELFTESLGWTVTKGEPIWIDGLRYKPDFDMKLGKQVQIVIEIDGPYHRTIIQEGKSNRRDAALVKAGRRVIHIGATLTEMKYWPYLKEKFFSAVLSHEPVIYIQE